MKEVTEKEFEGFFSTKWFVCFKGFFKNTKRYIIDGHYIGFKDEDNKVFRINYHAVKQFNL